MRNNNNSVSTLQYHIVWCTKYRHPVLTGAVEVETKTILAQTCTEYGWTLKAIEVMPEHVHIFLEASPDEAPSSIARRPLVSWMLLRECRCNHRGKREKVHRKPEVEHRRYRMMNCPICGKEMAEGTVISSGSMPFSTNVTFKFELHTENVRSCLILEKKAAAYYCRTSLAGFLAVCLIKMAGCLSKERIYIISEYMYAASPRPSRVLHRDYVLNQHELHGGIRHSFVKQLCFPIFLH